MGFEDFFSAFESVVEGAEPFIEAIVATMCPESALAVTAVKYGVAL